MPSVSDVLDALETLAPFRWAFSFDKIGLQVGRKNSVVQKAVVSLDWSVELLAFATSNGATLIVCHHPLIWEPLTELTERTRSAEMALRLAESGIAMIASHTNWDAAPEGVNDTLASVIGIKNALPFGSGSESTANDLQHPVMPIGRIGELNTPMAFSEFVSNAESLLETNCVAWGDPKQIVSKVAVVGGAADSEWKNARDAGADVFLTGEVKQDRAVDAAASGMCMVAAGHYATEQPGMAAFQKKIAQLIPEIEWYLFVPEPGFAGRPI